MTAKTKATESQDDAPEAERLSTVIVANLKEGRGVLLFLPWVAALPRATCVPSFQDSGQFGLA